MQAIPAYLAEGGVRERTQHAAVCNRMEKDDGINVPGYFKSGDGVRFQPGGG